MNLLGQLHVETPSDREIVLTRGFNAPRRLVFDAFTKPELVRRWMLGPGGWVFAVCDIDLRVGGKYRFVWRRESGQEEMGMGGIYREIVPGEKLVSNELFDEDWTGGETLATLTLVEENGQTLMTQTVLYSSRQARDGALKSGMVDGLTVGFELLDEVLAGELAKEG
jgi:uncharacterized protein YndB with AHSA1/START domain